MHRSKQQLYSITSSALASSEGGMARLAAWQRNVLGNCIYGRRINVRLVP
jgi:hypothetical protein